MKAIYSSATNTFVIYATVQAAEAAGEKLAGTTGGFVSRMYAEDVLPEYPTATQVDSF